MEFSFGCGNAICFIGEDDVKEVISLLMTIFDQMNLIVWTMFIVSSNGHDGFIVKVEEDDINIFGVGTSIEKYMCVLVIRELSLFWRLYILLFKCVDPFSWWQTHTNQFPNVGLPNRFLGFSSFKLRQKF